MRTAPTEAVELLSVCVGGGVSLFMQWAGWLPGRKGSLGLEPQTCYQVWKILQASSSPLSPHPYPLGLPPGPVLGDVPDPSLHLSPGSSHPQGHFPASSLRLNSGDSI